MASHSHSLRNRAIVSCVSRRWRRHEEGENLAVYGIATLHIADRTEFDIYQRGFMKIFERFDGELLAVDEEAKVKKGEWPYT